MVQQVRLCQAVLHGRQTPSPLLTPCSWVSVLIFTDASHKGLRLPPWPYLEQPHPWTETYPEVLKSGCSHKDFKGPVPSTDAESWFHQWFCSTSLDTLIPRGFVKMCQWILFTSRVQVLPSNRAEIPILKSWAVPLKEDGTSSALGLQEVTVTTCLSVHWSPMGTNSCLVGS